MTAPRPLLRRHAARLVSIAVIVCLGALTNPPTLSPSDRAALAEAYAFTGTAIERVASDEPLQTRRRVSPSLRRHDSWISAVGAAVALADLDHDGLPNDLCLVDPRTDLVTVHAVPGTATRYEAFTLWRRSDQDAAVAPMGCIPRDMNEDGLTDLFLYFWGRAPLLYLRTPGEIGRAAYVERELVPEPVRWYSNAATFADFDGDGHLDFALGNYFQDGARILDETAQAPDWMQDSMSRAFNGGRSRIFRWVDARSGPEPDVVYAEVRGALPGRIARGWTLALGAADLDGDLLPELYLAQDFGPDALLHNRSQPGRVRFHPVYGERHLATPASKVLGRDSFKGMSVDFADLNLDGRLDIYVSNITTPFALHESHFAFIHTGDVGAMWRGIAPFEDESEPLGLSRSGWGWDTRVGDFDNDGAPEALQATGFLKGKTDRWPELQELALGNDELVHRPGSWPRFRPGDDLSGHQPNAFFARAPDGRYYDVSAEVGIGEPHVTRGIATADVDADGDLDLAIANQWEPSIFFRNDAPGAGASLVLRLLLPLEGEPRARGLAGRPAIGARASVLRPGRAPLVAQVDGGNGHSGARSPELHFGLGALEPDVRVRVELSWRDARGMHREQLALVPGRHTIVLKTEDRQ